jgi:RNA polymerase sigma-70 factor (ECF subfamily)
MESVKEKDIVSRAGTFDRLYNRYFNDIYRFAYSLTGHPEEANDITQDTFIKLYQFLEFGVEPLNPKAWLYRVAANTSYNRLKRKKKFREIITHHLQPETTHGNIEEDLLKEQETALLRKAMNRLPPRDRVILTLYKEGFSTVQLAEFMKVKKNSAGKILARSIEKLAAVIKRGEVK